MFCSCFFNAIFSAVRQSSIKWLLLYLYTTVGAYALLIYEQGPVSTPERPLWINISRLWYTQFISALQCMRQRFGSNILCRNHLFLLTESLKSNLLILKKWEFACTDFWDSSGIQPVFVGEGEKASKLGIFTTISWKCLHLFFFFLRSLFWIAQCNKAWTCLIFSTEPRK